MNPCRLALFVLGVASVLPTTTAAQPVPVKAHGALVHSVAVSPDGKILATAGFDNLVKLWDIGADGTLKLAKVLVGHTAPVYAVAFHPADAKIVATASQDKTARVWDVTEGKAKAGSKDAPEAVFEVSKAKFELKGHSDIVDTIAFSPDGKTLATAGADKAVKLWNPADGKEIKALGTHDGSVYAVAFSPDGKLLASAGAGKDNLVKIWDVKEQRELTQLRGHEQPVTAVVFADNERVVTASMDRSIRTWTTKEAKKEPKEVKDPKDSKEPKKDAKDAKDAKEPKKDVKDTKEPKKDTKDSKDPKDTKEPKDTKDPNELKKFGPTTDDPYAIAWSPATKALAVCGYSGQITVWTLDADKPKFTRAIKSPGYCVVFSADGKGVFTGHDNGTVAFTPIVTK
ncbi:WD40 repeat domain-containing protein [Frigoriglobus tundricola]|uniref:High-affnity carbon uptake protein Hat/HatR n=1 Tax=Frigoriglobus tundricola TaxID=2774151 RepID=A0A6M5Z233_9BACT|nr:WD40 repeat domain-containing protein [Frigoriglobus tundricola]QJX00259.1 High-affnity carbon uptake protein Hat/HatR [Frigoriglobus tundricola]